MINVLKYIAQNYPRHLILFGVVIQNKKENVDELIFEQITSRFDKFLGRKYQKDNNKARGLCIFDKTKLENKYQNWLKNYQKNGNRWDNNINNFAEIPLCLDSSLSRLIQLADLIAYSIFRKYEYNDDTYFSIIKNCFDENEGMQHGLYIDKDL